MRRARLLVILVVFAGLTVGAQSASGTDVQHGLGISKGCTSPTQILNAYVCSFTVQNIVDEAHDTLTIHTLVDTVHAASGDVVSGNLLRTGPLTTTTTPDGAVQSGSACFELVRAGTDMSVTNGSTTATSATGAFAAADAGKKIVIDGKQPFTIASVTNATTIVLAAPYTGATAANQAWAIAFQNPAHDGTAASPNVNVVYCSLPFGSRVNVLSPTHYTVQPGDYDANPATHRLTDDGSLLWHDSCDDPTHTGNTNCDPDPPNAAAGSSSAITQIPSTTATAIHNAAHAVPFSSVEAPSTVHDFIVVSGGGGNPTPTGTANLEFFTNGTCASPAAASKVETLGAAGSVDATDFAQGPLAAGRYSFRAHYLGDPANATYAPSDGPCEPLTVVDAAISISPNGTNPVGTTHMFTGHLSVNDGTGFAPAFDGTVISFTLDSGPGTFLPSASCTTNGGTGSCQVGLTSLVTGTSSVSAHWTGSVAGLTLSRVTNGTGGSSGPATTVWVAAPNPSTTATAIHNAAHATVTTVDASATLHDFIAVSGGAGNPVPTGTANVEFFSNGTCALPASASKVETLGAGGSVDATDFAQGPLAAGKYSFRAHYLGDPTYATSDGPCEPLTVVDAAISISPNGTNRVGSTHMFTGHVSVNDGTGFAPAPAGTVISFTIDAGPGSFTPAANCTTAGGTGSCQVGLTSSVTGTSSVNAHWTGSVAGLALSRVTNGTGGSSGPAAKVWVDARISVGPDATNAVGQPHTFAVTLQRDLGNGAGFVAFPGAAVTVTLTSSNGATPVPAGPFTLTTDTAGHAQVTFTSATPGKVTGHASWTGTLGTPSAFTVVSSPDAVKTFVPLPSLTVTADGKSRLFGQANPPLTATLSGFVPGQTLGTSDVTGSAACTTTATPFSPAGIYPITCTQGTLASASYTFGPFVPGTLTVGYSQACVTSARSGPITIAAGQSICFGTGAVISGPVTVQPGGALDIEGGAFVAGSIRSTGATAFRLCGSSVIGPLTVMGTTGLVLIGGDAATGACAGSALIGNVTLTGNTGGVEFNSNRVTGSVVITGNAGNVPPPDTGPVHASGNTIIGPTAIQ